MEIIYTTVFDNAISAHVAWVVRFENVLNGIQTETFDPNTICNDRVCEFGDWLYANPAAFASSEHFDEVRKLHFDFHTEAAEIARLLEVDSGKDIIQVHLKQLQDMSNRLVELLFDAQDYSKLKLR